MGYYSIVVWVKENFTATKSLFNVVPKVVQLYVEACLTLFEILQAVNVTFDNVNHPRWLAIHYMVHIKNSIFLSACEGWGFIYACAPAAGATTNRRGALSRRFASHFGAQKCISEAFESSVCY